MVNYWLCVTSEENWNVIKDKKVWGVSERNHLKIERTKPGDFFVFYVKRKKIGGIFKVIDKPFKDNKNIFDSTGLSEKERFPYRVKLDTVVVSKKLVEIGELIGKLDFIINKKRWQGYFRRAMQLIPEGDFLKILSVVQTS
jgi:predicted RNA-binding protein